MGFTIKLANLIIKKQESDDFKSLPDASLVFNSDWEAFVSGELKSSNDQNSKVLGGRPRQAEEEEQQFDVNMEKIMSRFNTFNSLMSASSSTDDDNEEEEQPAEQPEE